MVVDNWLRQTTERGAAQWVSLCQQAILASLTKGEDPNHDEADPGKFIGEVTRLVVASLPPSNDYDGNMRAAAVLSVVLALWRCRLGVAKCHDPNRPAVLRQKAYRGLVEWEHALIDVTLDGSEDPTYFPGQRWDLPFAAEAESGDFI